MTTYTAAVAIVGGGVVGTAILHTLAHRGVDAILLEAQSDLAYQASGTSSGVLHTGFDSTPGQLETNLILRSALLRPSILSALDIPVSHTGAALIPHEAGDDDVIRGLADNAARNGVEVSIRSDDGALLVPGESVTDPVAFTLALGASARIAGARILLDAAVTAIDAKSDSVTVIVGEDHAVTAHVVINAAGLHADDVARLIGDDSFEIYPRKGEFLVFELPGGETLGEILLPVPTKRTKGVLVFPTLDGRVVAGPTAHDQVDKDDWSVRPDAHREVLEKAVVQYPKLAGLEPVAAYAGLRTAGRDANYIIEHSAVDNRLINVAAIRSTGLSACLGIASYVSEMLPALGIAVEELRPASPATAAATGVPWWRRTAEKAALKR
ncbi:NAD(P)/FAD-dependent oxidoreductase [Mycolicibacterium baixiangningiae]|uniref:NAD(P)/FAD-dependent oxidoreductase n=1 Tax=Mycolicibacterium baixiangningiae TaxID=2761578 RepID=UPI0018681344|nr:FAD-dependent oxidoreductase [Mycolicibacterium baixiangningiae]